MRLVFPTRSCPTSISLVLYTAFVPSLDASRYAWCAAGPRAKISAGVSSISISISGVMKIIRHGLVGREETELISVSEKKYGVAD